MIKEQFDKVGNDFYSKWKECKLSDIMELIGGGTPKTSNPEYWNGNIPWLSVTDFNTGMKYCFDADKKITEKGLKESSTKILKKGQIIISARGTVGVIAMLGRDMTFNQSNYGINAKEEITSNNFLYYLLKANLSSFISASYGAVFDTITKETFSQISVTIPPLQEQTAIASILSSLDDKIDLLHRQNKTLEQLAETLFRQWFVEDAKIDIVPLKKYVEVIDNRGKTPPFSDVKTDYPIVEVKSLSNNDRFVNYDACEKYVNEETYNNWFRKGHPIINDILISTVGSIGEMAYVIENKGGIAQNVIGLRAKGISPYYLYQYLSLPKTRNLIKDLDIGAVQPSIKVPHLLDLEIPIPKDIKLVMEFEMQLIPIFEKMKVNHFQIKTLTQTRDTLLPKLMSGEVRVEIV